MAKLADILQQEREKPKIEVRTNKREIRYASKKS